MNYNKLTSAVVLCLSFAGLAHAYDGCQLIGSYNPTGSGSNLYLAPGEGSNWGNCPVSGFQLQIIQPGSCVKPKFLKDVSYYDGRNHTFDLTWTSTDSWPAHAATGVQKGALATLNCKDVTPPTPPPPINQCKAQVSTASGLLGTDNSFASCPKNLTSITSATPALSGDTCKADVQGDDASNESLKGTITWDYKTFGSSKTISCTGFTPPAVQTCNSQVSQIRSLLAGNGSFSGCDNPYKPVDTFTGVSASGDTCTANSGGSADGMPYSGTVTWNSQTFKTNPDHPGLTCKFQKDYNSYCQNLDQNANVVSHLTGAYDSTNPSCPSNMESAKVSSVVGQEYPAGSGNIMCYAYFNGNQAHLPIKGDFAWSQNGTQMIPQGCRVQSAAPASLACSSLATVQYVSLKNKCYPNATITKVKNVGSDSLCQDTVTYANYSTRPISFTITDGEISNMSCYASLQHQNSVIAKLF